MPYLCHVNLLSLIMFKTNQQKETMQKTTYDLEEAIFHTEEDFDLIPHKEKTKKKETMETINDMIDYLEDNQNKIDNEIKDDQKAKKIFQQIEDLKNDLYEFIEVKGDK